MWDENQLYIIKHEVGEDHCNVTYIGYLKLTPQGIVIITSPGGIEIGEFPIKEITFEPYIRNIKK